MQNEDLKIIELKYKVFTSVPAELIFTKFYLPNLFWCFITKCNVMSLDKAVFTIRHSQCLLGTSLWKKFHFETSIGFSRVLWNIISVRNNGFPLLESSLSTEFFLIYCFQYNFIYQYNYRCKIFSFNVFPNLFLPA